jgi:septal ring factor EnvC (AmiA/AmiB activator)
MPAFRASPPLLAIALAAAVAVAAFANGASAQQGAQYGAIDQTRTALARAQAQARNAGLRAARLEVEARGAQAAAARTARQAAALAARIQQSEAGIAVARARMALAKRDRQALDRRLAERRTPLVRLTAGLQRLARRPLAVSILRPGSLRETVYLRAVLESALPEVRRRTASVRAELARGERIEREARAALFALNSESRQLTMRKQALAALESRQRLASRKVSGAAAREADRALALAEEARDLDALVGQLDQAGSLRRELAALPGPRMRPASPEAAGPLATPAVSAAPPSARPVWFQLPVAGQTVRGFGAASDGGSRSRGIALAPADGAQVVAPGAGRVAFAGPFRGFDRIVIIEHGGGYTSLVTGLARVDVVVGEELLVGAPLGVAGAGRPTVGFELRQDGVPVNPAPLVR